MSLKSVTFDLPESTAAALDAAAAAQHRDRNLVIHDAVEQYLAAEDAFRREIEVGVREADAGDLIDHAEVLQRVASWTRENGK